MKKGKRQCRNFGFGAASFFCVCPRWVARPTTFPPALFPVGDWGARRLSRQFDVGDFVFVAGDGGVEPLDASSCRAKYSTGRALAFSDK